ncbi:MAG: hypothetical protein JXB39_00780 [Deltaproteobacteria bacterium]|nr:hypothetical protein [Deltaproteobacteria bacterium]
MAQIGSWFSRVFSADATRGLSGDSDFLAGEGGSFYASRLRLHTSEGDPVADPLLLWDPSRARKQRFGLHAHLLADRGDGVARFTDILVVLAAEDWDRAVSEGGQASLDRVRDVLTAEVMQFCVQHSFNPIFPDRPFGISLVRDGAPQLHGHRIGLIAGQFVTGLLPNYYRGPIETSSPTLAVHLNLPGQWEGYRQVGVVHGDQFHYTLGSHWLDSFRNAAFPGPALYQLQQQPDGSLVHVVNPDFQDQYEVGTVRTSDGPAVLAIAARNGGTPVAWIVLAVASRKVPAHQAAAEQGPTPRSRRRDGSSDVSSTSRSRSSPRTRPPPDADVPTTPASSPGVVPPAMATQPLPPEPVASKARTAAGRESDPASGPPVPAPVAPTAREAPAARSASVQIAGEAPSSKPGAWQRTIVPEAIEERIFTLKERGALLQRVHFAQFMEGYDVFVSRTGQLGTAIPDPVAIFQVREDRVFFLAQVEGVRLAGRPLQPDRLIPLRGVVEIEAGGQTFEYRELAGVPAEGWPFLGEIRRPASSAYMVFGGSYRIGRDRKCKVRLPDEPHNDNIVWRMDLDEGDVIRSRAGDIPKSRFYNDSIMVASEHAEIDLTGEPILRNIARHCFSYVRRGSEVFPLFPSRGEPGEQGVVLFPGDEVLVGNNLFEVSFPPAETQREEAPAPEPRDEGEPGIRLRLPGRATASRPEEEPPAAHGLGEAGPAPERPPSKQELDSILGTDAPPPGGITGPRGDVVVVEEAACRLELSRPARLLQVGWMVAGDQVVGNHLGVGIAVPELRIVPGQSFRPRDYAGLQVRGPRGSAWLLDRVEARLKIPDETVSHTEELEGLVLEIDRRDPDGVVDFTVVLRLLLEPWLPDPRARLLALDSEDRLVASLFTLGMPLKVGRALTLGPIRCRGTFDGHDLQISDHLDSYALPDGTFRPFLHRSGDGLPRTVPEDGSPIRVAPGDHLVAGNAVFRFLVD